MSAWDSSVDRNNTARLKEILAVNGWPTLTKVGEKASNAAWLIAQHADDEPVFQQECLELMKSIEDYSGRIPTIQEEMGS